MFRYVKKFSEKDQMTKLQLYFSYGKSFEKWQSPLFGATGNINHQILPYGILFLTFISTHVFYLLSFNLIRSWPFPLKVMGNSSFDSKDLFPLKPFFKTLQCGGDKRHNPFSDLSCP
jgi:hypothetical protein